jgi:hypothetical protein
LSVSVIGERNGQSVLKPLESSYIFSEKTNNFKKSHWRHDFNGIPINIEYVDYIKGAEEGLVEDANGDNYLKIVESGDGSRHNHFLKEGEIASIHNILFSLNFPTDGAININFEDGKYSIDSPFEGSFLVMASQEQGVIEANKKYNLKLRTLYNIAGLQFVFPDPLIKGNYQIVPAEDKDNATQDALTIAISTQGITENITVLGGKGAINPPKRTQIGDLQFDVKYGSKEVKLPFSLKLNDFIADKYPGTEKSYSSFMSKVTVLDQPTFDYDIYMNHILNYKGYRFFQASFDPDEKGTVLSVNNDSAGTIVTYIGYFLLYIGLLGLLFFGKTRFKKLAKMLEEIRLKKATLVIVSLFSFTFSQAQHNNNTPNFNSDSLILAQAFDKKQAEKFGKLIIQDSGGRMKPANTFASELIRKVSKSDSYKNLDANQVLLSITQNPLLWYNTPFVYLKRGNDSLRKIVGRIKEKICCIL